MCAAFREEGAVVKGKGAGSIPDKVSEEAKRAVVFIRTKTDRYKQGHVHTHTQTS